MLKTKPDIVADKLRRSLNMEDNNKPDTIDSDLGSPVTPLQTRPSGLASAATTTTTTSSCSSSSSESLTKKSDSGRSISSASAQSTNSNSSSAAPFASAAAQSNSNISSAAKFFKSAAPSAAANPRLSSVSAAHSRPSNVSAGSTSPVAGRSGSSINSPKSLIGNQRSGRSSSTTTSVKSSAASQQQPPVKLVPTGNLFPSGKVQITGMTHGNPKSNVLGPGAKSYGYGSVMRGHNNNNQSITKPTTTLCSWSGSIGGSCSGSIVTFSGGSSGGFSGGSNGDTLSKKVMISLNPEEIKRSGNEMFKKGCFYEALKLYDKALEISPGNAAYHSNRAAALSGLGRIGEAVIECEEAIRLDPSFTRAHHRLATLLLRLGHVDNAGKHLFLVEEPSDPMVVKLLEQVDRHLNKCAVSRRRGEWNVVLTEVNSAMSCGADCSPQLAMCKVEALLKLLRLDDAQTILPFIPKVEPFPDSFSHIRFLDMIGEAYTYFVKSQMELALGRFENAVTFAKKALEIDPRNIEVETLYRNVRLITKAWDRGNDLYESERYTEASSAYTEGLRFDPSNATLFCRRADCYFKVGNWESSIEDCNHALLILPSYTKSLLQRAASYSKLERWAEAVRDYENLRKVLCYDKEIAESFFYAQVALKKSRGELVLNMEFGCDVEEISSLEELKAALTRPGVSVVHFMRACDKQCKEMCVFMEALYIRYPSMHFLKVEIEKCPAVADAEKVRVVPTFKIYKLGARMKEIVCPSKESLEKLVRLYSL
ncbi:unnamed protein product [Cochlearia groenlandica]